MLDTCLHKLGHFFIRELHFTGKDFLLDAGSQRLSAMSMPRV